MTPAGIARLLSVIAKLLAALMRRYDTDDPAIAAARMLEAMAAQDRIAAAARREHAIRRAKARRP